MSTQSQGQPEKIAPLWQSVVGETEPWRRGRLFLILLGIVTFCFQCAAVGLRIAIGDVEGFLVTGVYLFIFWIQFYLIWIGLHWIRWLSGGWSALVGFALVIWGWRDQSSIAVVFGVYSLCTGVYMALAPSVYFFAKRQRERIRWGESVLVAAALLLLVGSFAASALAMVGYRGRLERDAHLFADDAFKSIFTQHDTYFLLNHASKQLMETGGGNERLTRFLQATYLQAGDVNEIGPIRGSVQLQFSFPLNLGAQGEMTADGKGEHGSIRMFMTVGRSGGGWQIYGVHWIPTYSNPPHRASP